MPTPDEFRQYADECLHSARDATSEAERKAFLDMARTWTQAAIRGQPADGVNNPPASKPD
jgi:hypothetical protein